MARSAEVDAWFERYDNPMKAVVMAMRDIVLGADARIDECIKWQAPTFTYKGNLASFFPKSKQHASLMFHQGALIPGEHPRLEGTGDVSRVMKIRSVEEAQQAKEELGRVVLAWCAMRDGDGAVVPRGAIKAPKGKKAAAGKKAPAAKPAAKKKVRTKK